jgi:hypothetical protein
MRKSSACGWQRRSVSTASTGSLPPVFVSVRSAASGLAVKLATVRSCSHSGGTPGRIVTSFCLSVSTIRCGIGERSTTRVAPVAIEQNSWFRP